MHLLDLGDIKEVVEVHRVEVADPKRLEDAALILVLQPVPVLDLAVVVVLLAPTVVVARDLEHLKETELTVKIVLLMIRGQDPYHLPEKILSVAILVHPLLYLVRKLRIVLQPKESNTPFSN